MTDPTGPTETTTTVHERKGMSRRRLFAPSGREPPWQAPDRWIC